MTSNFDKYVRFVNQVTSDESKDAVAFMNRIQELKEQKTEMHRLLTGAVGVCSEGGEFLEIVKKMIFQGKPWDEANIHHLKIELGDIMWYVAQCCMALDVPLEEITDMNIDKLSKRYPNGMFQEYYSENRKEGDL